MANKRIKDLPLVTSTEPDDVLVVDGVTTRRLTVENFTSSVAEAIGTIVVQGARDVLTANRTYYYRAGGSDANTGLVNSAGGAFLTAQKAYDTICDRLDLNGFNAVIQCGSASGTVFTSGIVTSKGPVGNSGASAITWDGNNSIVRTTNGACLDVGAANGFGGYPQLTFQNIRFETLTSGNCINARGGLILGGAGVVFGASAGNHVFGGHLGQMGLSSYTVAGSPGTFQSHIYGYSGFFFWTEGSTTTISAAITVQTWVTLIQGAIGLMGGQTFVNPSNVTGGKYLLANSGTHLDTGGGGKSYLPGTIAGSIQPGATYDTFTDDSAWTAFTPVITSGAGAFTTVSCPMRYKQIGKTVFYTGLFTVTTIGSATGRVQISIPVPAIAGNSYVGSAFNFEAGLAALVHIGFLTTDITLSSQGAGAPITASAQRVLFSGSYEAA